MMKKRCASAVFAVWLSVHTTPSHSVPSALPIARVPHSDLDLKQQADRTRLNHRLRTAVDKVCGYALASDLRGQNNVRRCLKETFRNATSQMDAVVFYTR
ncbi:UrcA family protein [Sphingomonas sp.]|uniref:UrcA family protein n=1 Tax=Sphingomonas sp. TaxID=28214 RepID=UPI00345DD484